MTILIEKGIPIPEVTSGHRPGELTTAILALEIGDSFYYTKGRSLATMVSVLAKRKGRKFITRQEGDGARVWRTA